MKNLTLRDHVCVAAADLDGDGKVEIAAGAQWNPGETSDLAQSGAVFYLVRPAEAGAPWKPVALPHDPTTHRMRFVPTGKGHELVVLPLHGIGNKDGAGENTVKVRAHRVDPAKAAEASAWTDGVLGAKLHVTHNFDFATGSSTSAEPRESSANNPAEADRRCWSTPENSTPPTRGVGEIAKGTDFIAAVEPFPRE